jgi:hypothetical protein
MYIYICLHIYIYALDDRDAMPSTVRIYYSIHYDDDDANLS